MYIGKHEHEGVGNKMQAPGRHHEHETDNGRYGLTLSHPDRCPEEYYMFDIDRSFNNDPNSRR